MSSKKLILKVVADVREAKEGLAQVGQGIKGLFQLQQGSGREIANGALKAFDGLHGAMSKVMPVANAVMAVTEKAIELAQFAGQRDILNRQVSSATFEAMRAATRGLVDDQTLLQTAAKATHGDFKLTEKQMANVAAAAVALHNQGLGPIPDILNEISKALSEGEAEALKKYGISLGETGTKAEKLGRAHVVMAQLAASGDAKLVDSGTRVTQMLVHLKNLWDDIKVVLGAVVDVTAFVVEGFFDTIDIVGDAIGFLGAYVVSLGAADEAENTLFTSVRGVKNEMQEAAERQAGLNQAQAIGIDFAHRLADEYGRVAENLRLVFGSETEIEGKTRRFNQMVELQRMGAAAEEQRAKDAREAAKKARAEEDKDWKDFTTSLDKVMDHKLELVKRNEDAESAAIERITKKYLDQAQVVLDKMFEMGNALAPTANENQVDASIKRLQAMGKANAAAKQGYDQLRSAGVQALTQLGAAAGTSLHAIISGNKGAQASLSEVFKQLLDQLGTEMQINALKYLAMGTAAVFTEPAAAGGYFAAAGIFEAAALLAGAVERGVGAPAAAGGAGAGGGGAAANQNTAGRDSAVQVGQSGPVVHNYYINGFVGDEARLAREMESRRRKAELSGQVNMRGGARRA